MASMIAAIEDDWIHADEDELRRALEVGASGSLRARLAYTFSQALAFVFAPSEQLPFITLRMVNCMEVARASHKLETFRQTEEGRALLRERPVLDREQFARLRELPAETLGGAYARFAEARNLRPQFVPQPEHLDPEAAWAYKRSCDTHDIWHVVLNYETHLLAESTIALFIARQWGGAFLKLLGVLSCFFVLTRKPSLAGRLLAAARLARRCKPLTGVYWERRWETPLAEVRREFGVEPESHPALAARSS